ncbi:unnamed protein product [Caenorhabditis auriculariae]|uniref:Uncharacterized protein n=1 Tax=Caenorhabditis auriculariae TaxID=2777116 RepID=A0A8S1HU06_9PELO|nr:unnamed protein product [Caenorhabditis auriculariae]
MPRQRRIIKCAGLAQPAQALESDPQLVGVSLHEERAKMGVASRGEKPQATPPRARIARLITTCVLPSHLLLLLVFDFSMIMFAMSAPTDSGFSSPSAEEGVGPSTSSFEFLSPSKLSRVSRRLCCDVTPLLMTDACNAATQTDYCIPEFHPMARRIASRLRQMCDEFEQELQDQKKPQPSWIEQLFQWIL